MSDSPNPSPSPPQTPQSATQRLSRQESIASQFSRSPIESPSFILQANTASTVEDINEIDSCNETSHQLLLSPALSTPLSFDSRIDETEPLFTSERSVHQIPIYIETLTGTTFEMQIMSQETIYAVKFKLQVEEGIPVSQQHLLWQGEELKDEFTLDEYGIGFGAILRLVLGLRVGPLSESPLSTANSKETSTSGGKHDDISTLITDSQQPLTVLIFQNGNHIKLLTIGTGNTTASLSTAGINTSGSYDTALASTSMQKDDNGSRTSTSKSERRKKAKCERELENEKMRIKMDELRKKMKSMSIKKKQAKDASKKNASNKLPSINDDSKKTAQNQKSKIEKQAPVHLPSIIPSQSKSAKSSAKSCTGIEPVNLSVTINDKDLKENSEIMETSFRSARTRSTSLSPKNLLTMQNQTMAVNENKPKPLFYRISSPQSGNGNEAINETSVCGSIAVIKVDKRPQTTPFLGRINNLRKIPTLKELHAMVKTRSTSRKTSAVKSKKVTESKLPPVNDKKGVRCFQCKKRLGLAMRYECRCGSLFCATHRYSEAHNCNFDYREEGKIILQVNNPPVRASKLPKI